MLPPSRLMPSVCKVAASRLCGWPASNRARHFPPQVSRPVLATLRGAICSRLGSKPPGHRVPNVPLYKILCWLVSSWYLQAHSAFGWHAGGAAAATTCLECAFHQACLRVLQWLTPWCVRNKTGRKLCRCGRKWRRRGHGHQKGERPCHHRAGTCLAHSCRMSFSCTADSAEGCRTARKQCMFQPSLPEVCALETLRNRAHRRSQPVAFRAFHSVLICRRPVPADKVCGINPWGKDICTICRGVPLLEVSLGATILANKLQAQAPNCQQQQQPSALFQLPSMTIEGAHSLSKPTSLACGDMRPVSFSSACAESASRASLQSTSARKAGLSSLAPSVSFGDVET